MQGQEIDDSLFLKKSIDGAYTQLVLVTKIIYMDIFFQLRHLSRNIGMSAKMSNKNFEILVFKNE